MSAIEKKVIEITDIRPSTKPDLKLADTIVEPVEEKDSVIVPILVTVAVRGYEGLKWRLKALGELTADVSTWTWSHGKELIGSFWSAVWKGHVFPLRMPITDYQTGNDLTNTRMIGRLLGLVMVIGVEGLRLSLNRVGLALFGLGGVALVTGSWYVVTAFQWFLILVTCVYLPLGFWRARKYTGLKNAIVEELDRLVETKKCESTENKN